MLCYCVTVPLPARLTDAVVDGDIDLSVQLQCEDVGGGEWIAPPTPSVTPHPAAVRWTLLVGRWHVVNNRQHTKLTADIGQA